MDGDTGTGTMIGPLQLVVIGFPRAEAAAPEVVQTLVAAPPFATRRWREVHDH